MADLRETVVTPGQELVDELYYAGLPPQEELDLTANLFHGIIDTNFTHGTWGGDLKSRVSDTLRQVHLRRRELANIEGVVDTRAKRAVGTQALCGEVELAQAS